MKLAKRTLRNVLAGLLLAAPLLGATPAGAAVLVQYNFNSTTSPLAPSTVNSGLGSASSISIGVLSWTWTEPAGYLQEGPGACNTAALAVASSNYASFTLTSTNPINLSSLTLDGAYGSYANPAGYVLESSVDGYSSILSTADFTTPYPTFTNKTIDLSGASFQGLSSITFRIFGYCNNFSFLQFDNVTVNGTLGGTPLNAANTTISASPASISADGTSTSTLTVQARDANNNNLTSSSGTVTLSTTAGSLSGVTDNADGTYTATLTSAATPGTANITGMIGGTAIGHPASVTFIGPVSAANTTISANPASITANGTSTSTLTVQAKDANNSNLISSGGTVMLSASAGSVGSVTDNGNGTYTATLTSVTTAGTANITGTIGGATIGHPTSVAFTPVPVSAAITLEAENGTLVGTTVSTAVSGYSGTGYVTGFDTTGDLVRWNFTGTSGLYDLLIRFRSPFDQKEFIATINGSGLTNMFPQTTNFSTFAAGRVEIVNGANTLEIGGGWMWYEIDRVDLVPVDVAITLEAENGTLVGTTVSTAVSGYSGTGYVTGFDTTGDLVRWNFTGNSGLYGLLIRFRSPFGPKGFNATINGSVLTGTFPQTTNFSTFDTGLVEIVNGANTLEIGGGWMWYEIDRVDLVLGPVNEANTTISASPASITADGTSTSTLTVQARDANNNNRTSSSGTVTLNASAGSLGSVTDNGNGTYTATLTSAATPGTANITGTIGGTAIGHPASVTFIGPVSAANTTISASPASITANGTSTSTLTVQAKDANNSNLLSSGGTVTLNTSAGSVSSVTDNGNGTYTATLTSSTTPGTASITGTIGGTAIGHPASVTFIGPVSAANTTISANPAWITADETSTSTLTVQARDANNNDFTSSGGSVTLSTMAGSLSGVTDNADGTYTATLTSAATSGTANITGTIGGIAIGHPASVTFTPRAGTLQFNRIEFVPTGTHLVWNAAPGQSYSVLASSNLVNWSPTPVGVAGEFIDTAARAGIPQMFYRMKENINQNPRISIGKPTFGVTAKPNQYTSGLVDGIFKTDAGTWNAGFPTPAAPAWVAIHLGQGPTRVLLEWSADGNYNYQETDYGGPGNYAIYTSSNSTTGSDGTWSQVVSVTNNIYRTRSHSFDFTGMSWVKVVITAAPANSVNGADFDEIEVYDISTAHSRGRIAEDTWFFMGDSITAFWANRKTASGTNDPASHQPSFAAWINIDNTNYFPSMINGGIGGETTANGLARLAQNLADNPDYYYWALDYGANDAGGNNSNTASFAANMQAMINMLLANGRMPVIPHISYATDGGHNYVTNFNAVIDELVVTNGILAGPDCYTFFKANPNQLSDGLHPNDAGMRSYNLLWSQAMRHLYP